MLYANSEPGLGTQLGCCRQYGWNRGPSFESSLMFDTGAIPANPDQSSKVITAAGSFEHQDTTKDNVASSFAWVAKD